MGVPEGRVGDGHVGAPAQLRRECRGADPQEEVAGSGRQGSRGSRAGSFVRGLRKVVAGPCGWLTVTSAR